MKRILSVFIIFNSLNAGMGGSKVQASDSFQFDADNKTGELKLTDQEKELLKNILSNPKVLSTAVDFVNNQNNKQDNFSNNLNRKDNFKTTTQGAPVVPANFTINFNAHQNAINSSSSSSENSNEINISLVQQLYNYLKIYTKSTGSFLYRHKGKIILCIIIIIVVALFYKLVVLKYALTSTKCLTNCWQAGQSLSQILKVSTPELTKNLFQTMGTQFASPQAMANCSIPMTEFVKAIAAEKVALASYTKIGSVLGLLGIGWLFNIDQTIINGCEERMGKLNYMQKLFEEFIAKKCGDSLASGNF